MSTLTIPHTLIAGTPENVTDVKENFDTIATWANGNVDTTNIASSVLEDAGISSASTVRAGVTAVATAQSTTSGSYTTLSTPDTVSNVVVPSSGLLFITYQAMFKNSASSNGVAAIFIGSNQLKHTATGSTSAQVQETTYANGTANVYVPLTSTFNGLMTGNYGIASDHSGFATTGTAVSLGASGGGPVVVYVTAGTYDISVKFKTGSGTLTAKERILSVWTRGF